MGKNNKIIYLAPDIDISKNEGGKAHVLGEVKYLKKYFDKILLITKNKNNLTLGEQYKNVKIFKIPNILHTPIFRITLESLFFMIFSIYLRLMGYKFLIERSYRLGGIFSIVFCTFGGKGIYQLNEPIYYENYIMPIQNLIIKMMGHLNIKFFGTHESFSYNLPKGKYINGWRGCDSEITKMQTSKKKKYDIIYVGSVAKWHSLGSILAIIKNNPKWEFLFITSGHNEELINKKNYEKLDNLTIYENIENKKIYSYIYQSKIGLALYEKNSELLKKFDYCYSPIKVHEYKACGLPIIASNIGTLIKLTEHSGILVDNSINEIENAINILLNNKKKYEELSENATKEILEKYNWDYICRWYYNILS